MTAEDCPPVTPAIKKTGLRRWLFAGVALANVFVAGMVAYVLHQSRLQYEAEASVAVDNLSSILEENLVGIFDKVDDALLAMIDEIERQKAEGGMNRRALNAFIARRLERMPATLTLRVVDRAGDVDMLDGGLVSPVNIGDRPYFQHLRDDPGAGLVVSPPLQGRVTGRWRIAFARRLGEANGSFAGAVSGTIAVDKLSELFALINVGAHGNIALWDDAPSLVARYPDRIGNQSTVGASLLSPELQALIGNNRPAAPLHARSALDGIERTYFFRKVGPYPLYLLIGMADQDFLAGWQRQCEQMIAMLVLFATSSLVASLLVHRGWKGRLAAVDALARQEAMFRTIAEHDPLTGLPNRLVGKKHMDLAIARAGRLQHKAALLFLDLDRFKTINDSLGHPVGDSLLREVAVRLSECVRKTDTISRQGGDEFLIILDSTRDADAAARVSEGVGEALTRPFHIDGHELFISTSIGIAVYPDDGPDFDTLLKKADTAMYCAKEAGRNAYRFFTEQMNVDAIETLTFRNELNRGIKRREFVLHYQPQVDLASGRITGAEALIRWNHPELGLVLPGRFVPLAEDSGLIVPMGAWVLHEACRQAVEWQQAGLGQWTIAVNLSAVQFRRGDLLENVSSALDASGLDPQWLELELTESILIKDPEGVLRTVQKLKALGVRLSIDDFGTGYSSLAYLRRFEVDKLKIDQSFVQDISANPDNVAIVQAIVHMARSLGLRTIAEGVETESVLPSLRSLGCDEAQGYLFARPMPAEDLGSYLATYGGKAREPGDSLVV